MDPRQIASITTSANGSESHLEPPAPTTAKIGSVTLPWESMTPDDHDEGLDPHRSSSNVGYNAGQHKGKGVIDDTQARYKDNEDWYCSVRGSPLHERGPLGAHGTHTGRSRARRHYYRRRNSSPSARDDYSQRASSSASSLISISSRQEFPSLFRHNSSQSMGAFTFQTECQETHMPEIDPDFDFDTLETSVSENRFNVLPTMARIPDFNTDENVTQLQVDCNPTQTLLRTSVNAPLGQLPLRPSSSAEGGTVIRRAVRWLFNQSVNALVSGRKKVVNPEEVRTPSISSVEGRVSVKHQRRGMTLQALNRDLGRRTGVKPEIVVQSDLEQLEGLTHATKRPQAEDSESPNISPRWDIYVESNMHEGPTQDFARDFVWANVLCGIKWDKATNQHYAVITMPVNSCNDDFEDFEGGDTISIFSKEASVAGRFNGFHAWNDEIPIPMQRYHLPLIGNILSPEDQRLTFGRIPPSLHVTTAISKFLFDTSMRTPPSSGLQTNDRPPSDTRIGESTASPSFGPLQKKISKKTFRDLDFALTCALISHWFGFGSSNATLKRDAPSLKYATLAHVARQAVFDRTKFTDNTNALPIILNPYEVLPRRLWDLKVNRVIPTYLCRLSWAPGEFPEFIAISHSWVEENERDYIYSPINQNAWAIPVPRGIDLERIRNEVLGYFPSIQYCWLDVLCLRQAPHSGDHRQEIPAGLDMWLKALELLPNSSDESQQTEELRIDLPTIGNIYKRAAGVLRYFNGLGKDFKTSSWDHQHHWLNRSWTLQESIGRSVQGGLSFTCVNPLNAISIWRGSRGRLRDFLHMIEDTLQGINDTGSIIKLAREIGQRYATHEIDKIAGLSYLLHFDELPTYSKGEAVEDAWGRCLQSAPATVLAELFFNLPFADKHGLFPTWQQLQSSGHSTLGYLKVPSPLSIGVSMSESDADATDSNIKILFFGYLLHASLSKPNAESNDYYIVAYPKPNPRYPDMVMNLKFFLAHDVDLPLSNTGAIYQLFTHSLNPCSSWVVMVDGYKIGVLCTDEVFMGLHRSQIIEKGKVVADGNGLLEVFAKN